MSRRLSHFELREPLGEGGMGVVHAAFDLALERQVAIKLLRSRGDPAERERFLAEARAASAINHPCVVTVHEVGSEDGTDFIVMERVEGRTLAELLRTGPLPLARALRFARDIADGLASAHALGLVHRDLKPGNVMVGPYDRVKILDFGLAKRSSVDTATLVLDAAGAASGSGSSPPLTEPGMVVGTPAYMAPEQARGDAVDARSDLFALGCLLYEMLAGVPAFRGSTPVQVLAAVLSHQPPSLPRAFPGPSPTCCALCWPRRRRRVRSAPAWCAIRCRPCLAIRLGVSLWHRLRLRSDASASPLQYRWPPVPHCLPGGGLAWNPNPTRRATAFGCCRKAPRRATRPASRRTAPAWSSCAPTQQACPSSGSRAWTEARRAR
jgi:serine/threonine protein kinase